MLKLFHQPTHKNLLNGVEERRFSPIAYKNPGHYMISWKNQGKGAMK